LREKRGTRGTITSRNEVARVKIERFAKRLLVIAETLGKIRAACPRRE
jgi:hypothetical protein